MRIDRSKLNRADASHTGSGSVKVSLDRMEELGLYQKPIFDEEDAEPIETIKKESAKTIKRPIETAKKTPAKKAKTGPVKVNKKTLKKLEMIQAPAGQGIKVDLARLEELGLYKIPEDVPEQERKFDYSKLVSAAEFFKRPEYRRWAYGAAGFAICAAGLYGAYTVLPKGTGPDHIDVAKIAEKDITELPESFVPEETEPEVPMMARLMEEPVAINDEKPEENPVPDIEEADTEVEIPETELDVQEEAESEGEAMEEEIIEEEPEEEYTLVMADVQTAVSVREDPSDDAEKAGLLYKDCGGTILEQEDGWTKVESGELVGWVPDDYLLFNKEAKEKADEVGALVATVEVTALNIREEPGADAKLLGSASEGDTLNVVNVVYQSCDDENGWAEVEFKDETAYISAEYVEIEFQIPTGETMEEIEKREAEEEAKKKKEEEVKKKAEEAKKKAEEEAKRAEEEQAKAEETPAEAVETPAETPAEEAPVETAEAPASPFSQAEINMLAAIIYCEAGNQPYEGKVGVGNVVLNRLNSPRFAYATTIEKVIRAPGQFTPVKTGKFDRVYSSGSWSESCYQAALDAISGVNTVGDALFFKNPKKAGAHAGLTIADHVFW